APARTTAAEHRAAGGASAERRERRARPSMTRSARSMNTAAGPPRPGRRGAPGAPEACEVLVMLPAWTPAEADPEPAIGTMVTLDAPTALRAARGRPRPRVRRPHPDK